MRCRVARRLLLMKEPAEFRAYRRVGLDRHLGQCECCREEAAKLSGEERLLRVAYADLPLRPGFTEEVLVRIGALRPP